MVGVMTDERPPLLLQLKVLLRDVHPAVWRRVWLADSGQSVDCRPAPVIQLLSVISGRKREALLDCAIRSED